MLAVFFSEYDFLPTIEFKDVNFLYYDDYWDGPLSGMVMWNGEKLWALFYDEEDDDTNTSYGGFVSYRYFVLMRLSEEDHQCEKERHDLWKQCCGNYSFDLPSEHKPELPQQMYYDKYPIEDRKKLYGEPVARMVW